MRRRHLQLARRACRSPAPISIRSFGIAHAEDFNTLATAGTANTALPVGWALADSGMSSRGGDRCFGDLFVGEQ